jgi:hypothetical protein
LKSAAKGLGAMPKIPDPELPKLPPEVPVPVNIPFVVSNLVVPAPPDAANPVPDPTPPAEPRKFSATAWPPPKLVAVPAIVPVPSAAAPMSVPVVVPVMAIVPEPIPKPPVGPLDVGTMEVRIVSGVPAVPLEPPFLLPPEVLVPGMPGMTVMTVLKRTGLTPAPKPPLPFEAVVPLKLSVPIPVVAKMSPACVPAPPAAALPAAVPKTVLIKPELPAVVVKSPDPLEPEIPAASALVAVPSVVTVPPPVEIPEITPPVNLVARGLNCAFLEPLRPRPLLLLLEAT